MTLTAAFYNALLEKWMVSLGAIAITVLVGLRVGLGLGISGISGNIPPPIATGPGSYTSPFSTTPTTVTPSPAAASATIGQRIVTIKPYVEPPKVLAPISRPELSNITPQSAAPGLTPRKDLDGLSIEITPTPSGLKPVDRPELKTLQTGR
jgi:hypothetical protein